MREVVVYSIFHPTTLVLIDDNVNFLKALVSLLSDRNAFYVPYDNSYAAVKYINQSVLNKPNLDVFFHKVANSIDEIDFYTYERVYDQGRFLQISGVVSDYEMPVMNGLELFQQIKDLELSKVMLTGIVTDALAGRMIKEGLIEGFIRKSDFNFAEEVAVTISRSNEFFFSNLDKKIKKICTDIGRDILMSNKLEKLIMHHIKAFRAIEYYMLDDVGSYLFLNAEASAGGIFVYQKACATNIYNRFKNHYSHDLLKNLVNGDKILCYPYRGSSLALEDLSIFVRDSTWINDDISYVYVEDASYLLDINRIISFKDFKVKMSYNQRYMSTLMGLE